MRILVVEDESRIRRQIVKAINGYDERIEVIEKEDANQIEDYTDHLKIDIFLLDIGLPNGSGVDIAEKIRKSPLNKFSFLIFITAYKDYMLEAFKQYHCYDFLEKPFDQDYLIKIINSIKAGVDEKRREDENRFIVLNLKNFILKIHYEEIYFLEVEERKCIIHTTSGQHIVPNATIKRFEDELPKGLFERSHRAYIVNVSRISYIEPIQRKASKIYFEGYEYTALMGSKFQAEIEKNMKCFGNGV